MITRDVLETYLTFCESRQEWLLETIEALVRQESPTTDKIAVDRCGAELHSRLEAIGGRVDHLVRRETGDHLVATFGDGASQVMILGHFDTVWPVGQLQRMPLRRSDGQMFGPGVYDMKAGIGLGMLAVRALLEVGSAPGVRVVMLWTTDEEMGSGTSHSAILELAGRSDAVLVLEPSLPGGAVKTSRKGCGQFELVVTGVSAHAGIEPRQGASAIHELARHIVALEALQDIERGVSVNVGTIEGGSRPNVVAEQARAVVDIRVPTQADASRMHEVMTTLRGATPRTTVEVTGRFRPPLERGEAVIRLYQVARGVAADLGRELGEGGTGGGSDGNLTAAHGIPTLDGLGAVGDGAHALHEHIDVAELPWRAALLAGLIGRLGDASIEKTHQ